MGYTNNFFEQIQNKLAYSADENDESISLLFPEPKLKKYAAKINNAIREVFQENMNPDMKMYFIILSMHEYFDYKWLAKNILDDENKAQLTKEMTKDYHVKIIPGEPKKSKAKKQVIVEDEAVDSEVSAIDQK